MQRKILILDDNPDVLEIYDFLIAPYIRHHFAIESEYCTSLEVAKNHVALGYIAVISDYQLGQGKTALDLYLHLRSFSAVPFIFFSASEDLPSFPHDAHYYLCLDKNWRILRALLSGIICAARESKWCTKNKYYYFE